VAGRIKFYMDEHVPPTVTEGLRRRGVDVLTAQEAQKLAASDEEHLAFARAQERAIFTQDADFLRLHAAGIVHAGIAYAPQQTPVGDMIRGLVLIAEVLEPSDMADQVEFL